jgi:nucleotidyltransferase/DNA polymerase involved in DNA repair
LRRSGTSMRWMRLSWNVNFGRCGCRLYKVAHGIDHNPVRPYRSSKSIYAEDIFEIDIPPAETEPLVRKLAEESGPHHAKMPGGRTIVLKLKTKAQSHSTRDADFTRRVRKREPMMARASLCTEIAAREQPFGFSPSHIPLCGVALSESVAEQFLNPRLCTRAVSEEKIGRMQAHPSVRVARFQRG